MTRKLKFLLTSIASTGSVTLPLAVMAQDNPYTRAQGYTESVQSSAGVTGSQDLPTIIGRIINVVLGFLGILLLVLILYAGFLWMTAGGDSGKVEKAQTMLRNAIIGLIIVVAAFAISNFVLGSIINSVVN
ncbi:hypothetical protein GF380_00095 [Candidatus Uhrbacteria bacterium]|nr:hypothetical protein [Candidatus Uhrbacteria bacterium]MBD3283825.1 hypothetical protein [Candidatus Uhrbacteria bacterium]